MIPLAAAASGGAALAALRAGGGRIRQGRIEVRLAAASGLCYGVERAIRCAEEALAAFPGRRAFLASALVHNPQVNGRLRSLGVRILSGAGGAPAEGRIGRGDLVIVPAFGASAAAMASLRATGALVVDTTCGSVMAVWRDVGRLARQGFTVVLHGEASHEESLATVSRAEAAGGRWCVVRDPAEAERIAIWIMGPGGGAEGRARSRSERGEAPTGPGPISCVRFPLPASAGFDPGRDLGRIGLAHQTTMLASDSRRIAEILRGAVAARFGEPALPERFRGFDTICSATQDRQDAVEALGFDGFDLCLVAGGRESRNTAHLAEVAARFGPAYHVEGAEDLFSAAALRHWRGRSPAVSRGWLPRGVVRVGLASGASTPDAVAAAVLGRLFRLAGDV